MYRWFSPAERGRQKRRLELSVAGLRELEMLKRRHETLILSALTLHAPDGPTRDDCSPRRPRRPPDSWSLMNLLQHQVGELRVDADLSSVEPPADAGDRSLSSALCVCVSGFNDQIEGQSPIGLLDSSGFSEVSPWSTHPVRLTERPKSVGDAFAAGCEVNRVRAPVPRSLSAPHPPLDDITEGVGEDEPWAWRSSEEERAAEDYRQAQRVETYILGLIQRRSLPLRSNKPRTSLGPEARGVVRQSSLCRKETPYSPERRKPSPSPERHAWACRGPEEEQHSVRYPKPALAGVHSTALAGVHSTALAGVHSTALAGVHSTALAGVHSTALDFPCGLLEPSSSETESPQHSHGYRPPHSPSSDEQLVNAQYIPAQPHAQTRATAHRGPAGPKPARSAHSPERKIRAAPKKCRFTEEKVTAKKAGRKACRAQSENSLLGQRVSERKYNTVERDAGRSVQPKTRRAQTGSAHRRWRSTLELSQDEAEPPPEQPIRRSRRARPAPPPCVYGQPSQHPQRAPLCLPEEVYSHPGPGESESSLSEAETPGSSSLSSDSDESGGLVWPQQVSPQLAPPSPPTGAPLQPKAFVKIKASHALKKKILRFRTGSLKVMTTV